MWKDWKVAGWHEPPAVTEMAVAFKMPTGV